LFTNLLQYYHTAKYLKGRQIAGQVRNRVRNGFESSRSRSTFKVPLYSGCVWSESVALPPAGGSGAHQPHALEGRYTFLNRTEQQGWPPSWKSGGLPKLWLYNLHYFDWIWNIPYEQARQAVNDWIAKYPLKRNRAGWEPYPVSLRLMNWVGYFFGKNRIALESDYEFSDSLWKSLYLNASWLMRHLESHLLANHLFENAAALLLTGSCFEGTDARNWRERGLAILQHEIEEQILPDGMHFERSPMYHSRVFYVLLLLAAAGDQGLERQAKQAIGRMAGALASLVHPDGRIALLNDSAFGIYHEPDELLRYASELLPADIAKREVPVGPVALKDAGYYGWRSSAGNYIICDAGPIGPDYQPGHAHAGIFSFELSLGGRRVVVDSGVCSYEPGADRNYCRATRAHNTVEIAGRDQCEMWGSFRVARRARVRLLEWTPSDQGFTLHAVHDGYKRLRPGLLHSRRFDWNSAGFLQVTDSIEGARGEAITARLHLGPDCLIDQVSGKAVLISVESMKLRISFQGNGRLAVEDSLYCPEFGQKVQNKQIVFSPETGSNRWRFEISKDAEFVENAHL
jgi:uncharacterized heparinase superfamily protein